MAEQTIRRKVDTETYEAIASGFRSFVSVAEQEDVAEDDWFVFVEMIDGSKNREVYRQVAEVIHYEDADLYIAGFKPPEFETLEGIFNQGSFIVGHSFTKENGEVKNIYGPVCLPIQASPYVDPKQINDFLGAAVWPDGQYSIIVLAKASPVETGQQDVEVIETNVLVRTLKQVGDDQFDMFVATEIRFLAAGLLRDRMGQPIEPFIGDNHGPDEMDQTSLDRIDEIEGAEGF
jgi:hypothetical protein